MLESDYMKISVIVPVYNVEKYLNRCIDSILAQTYRDFELILVDDGSPDNCGEICDEYAAKDNRIHVIHKENGGLSDARNAGLDWMFANSKSEWVTFVDSDDWIHPRFLEIMYEAVTKFDTLMSVCNYSMQEEYTDYPEINQIKMFCKESEQAYIDKNIASMPAWAKLYHRTLWNDLRFPKGKVNEDAFTTHIPFFNAKQVTVVYKELYYYFTNNSSLMRSEWTPKKMDEVEAWKKRLKYLKFNNYKKAYKKDLITFLWIFIQRLSEIDKEKYKKYVYIIKLNLTKAIIKSRRSLSFKQKRDFIYIIKKS